MKFSVFQISRKGGREKNEDRMGYCYTTSSGLFLLADGMGGHPEGEVAAQIALQVIAAHYQKEAQPTLKDVREFFSQAILAAHLQILRYAAEQQLQDVPRTTLVVAVLQEGAAHWAHCGDSRLYLVRQGELLARTRDHSYAEQRGMAGLRSALPEPDRNVLFTCLGSPKPPAFDIAGPVPLRWGDRILLCSDGLWGPLQDADIVRGLSHQTVAESAQILVDDAMRQGGPHCDNVTVVALEWEVPEHVVSHADAPLTDDSGDSVFASTVQAGWVDALADDLDDAAIERSIAEINEAIRRSIARRR
jgi:PPM family protein phosphatase